MTEANKESPPSSGAGIPIPSSVAPTNAHHAVGRLTFEYYGALKALFQSELGYAALAEPLPKLAFSGVTTILHRLRDAVEADKLVILSEPVDTAVTLLEHVEAKHRRKTAIRLCVQMLCVVDIKAAEKALIMLPYDVNLTAGPLDWGREYCFRWDIAWHGPCES